MSVARRAAGHRFPAMSPLAPSTAQDILGGIDFRAGGDRVRVRPVKVAEADAVVSDLGVVRCLLKLPSSFGLAMEIDRH